MKRILKIILSVIMIVVVLFFIKKIYNLVIINNYDYIVVGNNCNCQTFRECKHTIVSKNKNISEIKKGFKQDKSNLHKIAIGTDTIAYFPYDMWYDMYKSLGYIKCSNCIEYENAINEYLPKYKYKESDKLTFNKIVNLLGKEKLEYIEYFIITDKNYYIFDGLEETIYKYNKNNESLDIFMKINTCDIDYFYEK